MKTEYRKALAAGCAAMLAFGIWTLLVRFLDVQPAGVNGTDVGFAAVNTWVHQLTGEHLTLYRITDFAEWLCILIAAGFGALGCVQLFQRKSLKKVDPDLVLLGVYFLAVLLFYAVFNKIHINYRPLLIDGEMEESYPSSTTLLALSVMPVTAFQVRRRAGRSAACRWVLVFCSLFAVLMTAARLISGVHWLTDILGSVILSAGLYLLYRAAVLRMDGKKEKRQ